MKPTKAYILRIDNPTSIEYAETCARSCEAVGLPYEFFEGYKNLDQESLWKTVPLKLKINHYMDDRAACATAGHFMIWDKIAKSGECAVVLEHDAIMLHPMNFDIPDGYIVTLGYKFYDAGRYDHVAAGSTQRLVDIPHHGGAHAYAITAETAKLLLNELDERGVVEAIDNLYFMRNSKVSRIPMKIADPTPAIGWLRKSTIWNESAEMNWPQIDSFIQNYK
jgi:GR25 family glycosyltransferase involved in LPS biosynthesis